jgi:hypothetical protein
MRTTSTQSHLTATDVLEIRRLHDEEGMNDAELARQFAVTRKAIYKIVNRLSWADVPAPRAARGFRGYTVYPDGRVRNGRGQFLSTIDRATGPAVRVRTSSGERRTVPVQTLIQKAFGKQVAA